MGGGLSSLPAPFDYPTIPHQRRHGPYGYRNYESYRNWLRDEFGFRCVTCLRREQWSIVTGSWEIDHFVPRSWNPNGILDYDNLLYLCSSCNGIKGNRSIPDPCEVALVSYVRVDQDGRISALSPDGRVLIDTLRLDNEDYTTYRNLITQTLQSLAVHAPELFVLWMKYPDDLPDLRRLMPLGNTRPEGLSHSHYARRIRNELPEIY